VNKEEQIQEMAECICVVPDLESWAMEGALALYAAGYRKLPEKLPERPKVLSDEELMQALRESKEKNGIMWHGRRLAPTPEQNRKAIAQIQLEADIKHYEG
jgi:hypothetical protein